MTYFRGLPALAAALVAGIATPAVAQSADAEYRRDCTADYQRLCSTFNPGSPEVEQCFKKRISEVSPRCQATIKKYSAAAARR